MRLDFIFSVPNKAINYSYLELASLISSFEMGNTDALYIKLGTAKVLTI